MFFFVKIAFALLSFKRKAVQFCCLPPCGGRLRAAPMLLSYEAYNELGEEELEQYNQQELLLWERMLDAASLFLPK